MMMEEIFKPAMVKHEETEYPTNEDINLKYIVNGDDRKD